ncbi:alpha/beta hydrolase [Metarhizium anisopliae]
MRQVFPSTFFNFEFLRLLGTVPYYGAEVGECLETASRIKDGDPETWYQAWWDIGQEARSHAEDAAQTGDKTAASWAYIRSANYFRASEFLLHCTPNDPRILAASRASVDAFNKGWVLLDADVREVEIPYDNDKTLPGRLYLPAAQHRVTQKLPLIVQTGGFDSTQEELYFYGAAGALPRGYAVLTFDGPGQGRALREKKLYFRPDWEHVTGQVLDFVVDKLSSEYDLDLDRLSVFGASLGGYLSLRAATDARIKACITVDGPFDLFDITKSRMPAWFINGWLSGWLSDKFVNSVIGCLERINFQLAWEFGHSKWVYGVDTPADVLRFMQKFTLHSTKNAVLSNIRCPTLVTGAADSFYFTPDQNAHKIMEGLTCLSDTQKRLWIGNGVKGGGLQAKIGALALVHYKMFAWLDKTFGIERENLMNKV